jgi:hypothetical protein
MKKGIDMIWSIIYGRSRHQGNGKLFALIWMLFTMGFAQFLCYPFHLKHATIYIAVAFASVSFIAYVIYPGFTYREEVSRWSLFEWGICYFAVIIVALLFYFISLFIYFPS